MNNNVNHSVSNLNEPSKYLTTGKAFSNMDIIGSFNTSTTQYANFNNNNNNNINNISNTYNPYVQQSIVMKNSSHLLTQIPKQNPNEFQLLQSEARTSSNSNNNPYLNPYKSAWGNKMSESAEKMKDSMNIKCPNKVDITTSNPYSYYNTSQKQYSTSLGRVNYNNNTNTNDNFYCNAPINPHLTNTVLRGSISNSNSNSYMNESNEIDFLKKQISLANYNTE